MMKLTEPVFDTAEIENLRECLASGWVTQGPFTRRFEDQVKKLHGVRHGFAVTSCTAALHLAAVALDFKPGDEILVPAFTWVTSANAAEYVGAKPVFVDVDPVTFNLDPEAAEAAIGPRTRGIVVVHLFGLAADMDPIMALARKHGLKVIEDAACAVGTTYRGTPVGGFGDVGCFSFHPRKIVTTGEGGFMTTNRDDLAALLNSLRNHGSAGPALEEMENPQPWTMARFPIVGFNYRMSDIQAAVGVAQMEKFYDIVGGRRACAERYLNMLAEVEEDLQLPYDLEENKGHTYQSFVVRVRKGGQERRNALMVALGEAGIETRPGTHAVHRLDYYRNRYSLVDDVCPNATLCEETSITLPLFPHMTEAQQKNVLEHLKVALARTR